MEVGSFFIEVLKLSSVLLVYKAIFFLCTISLAWGRMSLLVLAADILVLVVIMFFNSVSYLGYMNIASLAAAQKFHLFI